MYSSGHGRNIPCRVSHLGIAKELKISRGPVEVKRVGPALLHIVHTVHIAVEEEGLGIPVIPSGIGRKHVLLLPRIGIKAEMGYVAASVIENPGGLHENGVSEHIHIVGECKLLQLGIVSS